MKTPLAGWPILWARAAKPGQEVPLQEEGRRTYPDAVIAGLIALAATVALFLDTRIENRAFAAGGAARAVFGRGGPDAVASAPVDPTLVVRKALGEEVKD